MQLSDKGLAFLETHEGVVLKAYRDPVGVWTIGAGLTAASGVVKPKAGMVITIEFQLCISALPLGSRQGLFCNERASQVCSFDFHGLQRGL